MNHDEMNFQPGSPDELRLWEYLDGFSGAEEKTVIERLIHTNAEWRAKYNELLEVQQLLKSSELEEPSLRFTKNVMEEISKLHIAPATKNYINKNIIRGLAIFFVTLIVGFLVYGFGQIDWTASGNSKLPVDISKVDISKLDYSKIFSNNLVNVFMMINVILGLFLLDRYLANKRKQFREKPEM
jgi:hypothetical protein